MPEDARPDGANGTGVIRQLENFFDRFRKFALNAIVVTATTVVTYAVFIDGWSGSYSIEPIGVPEEFNNSGRTKEGTAAFIRDELGKLVKLSRTNVAIRPTSDRKEPDLSVIGTSFSLSYFVGVFRDLFGRRYSRISGELTIVDQKSEALDVPALCPQLRLSPREVKLVLRVADDTGGPFFEGEGSYEDVGLCGAVYALRSIDPYSAAAYLGQRDETTSQAIETLDYAMSESVKGERPVWVQRSFYFSSDIPRAYLIRANILLGMGRAHFQEAIELFNQANNEYAKRHFDRTQWYPAFDGIATAYLEQENYELAVANVERSLALQPDYDSAMFHRAQIPDFEFRKTMAAGANNCSALRKFDEARALYARLLELHPDVAVGYLNQGIMLLNKATRLRFDGGVGCDIEDTKIAGAGGATVALEKIENEAEEQFRKTIALDPKNGDAWMQWGILLRQRQLPLPSERGGALEGRVRRPLLASAIEKLRRALQLKEGDPFIEDRLKAAQNELAALR